MSTVEWEKSRVMFQLRDQHENKVPGEEGPLAPNSGGR